MQITDHTYFDGTERGRGIMQLQTKILDDLVNSCTTLDIGNAIATCPNDIAVQIEYCFRQSKSSEFYQLVFDVMQTKLVNEASKKALELGQYEF